MTGAAPSAKGRFAMRAFRALIRDHARLAAVLLALALAVKALVPAGFMLQAGGERFLTVTICSDASGTAQTMRIALPDKPGGHSDMADKAEPCAFAGLGHGALAGADPLLLAAAIAFVLLLGLAPLDAPPARAIPFLRPPLRGPPALRPTR